MTLLFYDYYKIRQGKLKEIALQLPDSIKERIKNLIWKTTDRRHFVISTFIIGFLIGILEFPCTGQIYFPIVVVLREVPALRVNALGYLVLYDLMFIMPLVIVFFLVFFSTTQAQLSRFLEERSGLVKLFTAFVFFLMGAIILLLKFA